MGLVDFVGLVDLVGEVGSDPRAGLGGQRRRIGALVGAADGVDHRLLHDPRTPDLIGVAEAFRFEHEFPLRDEDPPAVDPRPGEHDDAGEVGAPGSEQRRDQSPFAVADDADPCRIDVGAFFEPLDRRFGISCEVDARRLRRIAARAADAAIVVTEDGNPGSRQGIGEDEERLVIHERLVAVLLTRAGDEHHGRPRPGPLRERERAGEIDAVVGIPEGGLTDVIRERGLGGLRPSLLRRKRCGRAGGHLLEDQRQVRPPLLPGAGELSVGPELPGKLPLHRRHLDRPGLASHNAFSPEAARLLAEAVHADISLAICPLPDPEAERKFLDDRVESAGPDLVGRRRHCLPGRFPEGERQRLAPLSPGAGGHAAVSDGGDVDRAGRLDLEDELPATVGEAFEEEASIPFIEAAEAVNGLPLFFGRFNGEAELPVPCLHLTVPVSPRFLGQRRRAGDRGDARKAEQHHRGQSHRQATDHGTAQRGGWEERHGSRRQGRPCW